MRKEPNLTVGQWCDRWFCENQGRWSSSTVGGYRNPIYRHILPRIGGIPLAELIEDAFMTLEEGKELAENIFRTNAKRIYDI